MGSLYFLLFIFFVNKFTSSKGLRAETIIDGEEAPLNHFKYVVAVMYNPRDEYIPIQNPCTATLIGNQHITTVAHCFYDAFGRLINKEFYVITSSNDLLSPVRSSRKVRIESISIPYFYDSVTPDTFFKMGDIAVARLAEELPIVSGNWYLRKLKIARRRYRLSDNNFTVAGYGWNTITYIEGIRLGQSDGKLRFANAEILDRHYCTYHKINGEIAAGNMCAQIRQFPNERKGICQGDSGAPLSRGEYLFGIAIHGFADCNENQFPGIYLDVAFYADFILGAINRTANIGRTFYLIEISPTEFTFFEN